MNEGVIVEEHLPEEIFLNPITTEIEFLGKSALAPIFYYYS